ncbi:putative polysaccharide transporter protein [Clostridium perfringens ATCC 13124]|uniref:Polysaccharide transporter protein n=1 Tax=Clostridium perfringens (strain ATCC 13124 / DSM 756 / JCM 1290 / NCIMB 6125 / NCTC 8237 / Type A) TaxID=195103 RepID=A0A0H2YPV6_CLOP1|nr:oligosaccharide flippase family protein [Clostridium perfringens]ABG82583.1 putative polysaccharide transporter protein [Clostridium perfringens ATCC 13124]
MGKKVKNAAFIYAFGQILSKSINFIFIPLYTNKLGTYGYGQLALIDMLFSLISVFIILGINSGYIRFYKTYNELEKKRLMNTTLTFSIIFSIVFIIVNMIISQFYINKILSLENLNLIFFLLLIRCATEQIIYLMILEYSMNYEAKIVVKLECFKLILNLTLIVYFVAIVNQGILGMYKGYVISNCIILAFLIFKNINKFKLEIDFKMLKNMLKYSIQLIPSGISAIVLNLADRYILEFFSGLSITGIYSLGYKFGTLIDPLFILPFKKVFTPFKFEIYRDNDANEKLNEWYYKYNIIGIAVVFMISILGKLIIIITSPVEFINAYKIIPLILISYFIYGKSEFYSLGIYISNKTRFDCYIMILSGIINIILNFILIPFAGMYGATIATIISYYLSNILFKIVSKRCCEFRYNLNKNIVKFYVISIILYLSYFILTYNNTNLLMELLLCIFIILIWAIITNYLKIIDKKVYYKIIYLIKKKVLKNENM